MRFAILSFPGSSCDVDMYHALLDIVGVGAEIVSHQDANLEQFRCCRHSDRCFLRRLFTSGRTCAKLQVD